MEMFRPLVDEGLEVRLDECRGHMPEEDVIACLPDVEAVIAGAEPYTRKVLESAPALRVIARAGVGVNNVDLPAATERGILVANAAGRNSESVAEHLFTSCSGRAGASAGWTPGFARASGGRFSRRCVP